MKRNLTPFLFLIARAMLTATFILSALRHITHWSAALDEMAGDGMPRSSLLLLGSIAFRLIGGLLVLVGFRARIGATLLVLFILPAAFLAHDFWALPPERQMHEMIEFLNNLAIAGGRFACCAQRARGHGASTRLGNHGSCGKTFLLRRANFRRCHETHRRPDFRDVRRHRLPLFRHSASGTADNNRPSRASMNYQLRDLCEKPRPDDRI